MERTIMRCTTRICNIYLNDLSLFLKEIDLCNFADDTTPFASHKSLAELLGELERNSDLPIHWFENNYMKLNADKCHLLISSHIYEHQGGQIGKDTV